MSGTHLSDDELIGFVDGTLAPERRRRWLEHADTCEACHELIAAAAPAAGTAAPAGEAATLPAEPVDGAVLRGARVGRFTVLELLGVGATAEVHTAYDPRLDRRVALKLLHRDEPGGDQRLIREAQVLARLAHPNVVAVFDVGEHGERRFVAMELVEGETLRAWLAAGGRAWAEVLRMFIAAGRGLAAAHAVGIVHRDFKPDNVLIGADGRPRVADFGLARAARDRAEPGGDAIGDMALTQTGAVVGTPAYMAPEQVRGEAATPASDQFAFCVSLWEGLSGGRPFDAAGARARLERIERGEHGELASDVPAAVRRALHRGLAAAPDGRWPSIDALLAALETALPRRRRAAIAAAVAAIAAAGAGVAITVAAREADGPRCELAAPAGIWDPDVQQRVARAFAATGRPYAADTAGRVGRAVEERLQRIAGMRREACEATAVRGEQSPALLDLRMACLDRREAELGALVRLFGEQATVEVLDGAVDAVARLEPVERCDRAALAEAFAPPPPAIAPAVAAVRRQLAGASALVAAGSYTAGVAAAQPLLASADTVGYPPLAAEVRLVHARALLKAASPAARDALHDAALAAARARDRHAEAQALSWLVSAFADEAGKLPEALEAARHAELALVRAGEPAELKEDLAIERANVLWKQARVREGRALMEDAIAARRRRGGGDDVNLARMLQLLASLLGDHGQAEAAPPLFLEALAIMERRLGPEHPNVGVVLNNFGNALEKLGKFDEARRQYERALQLKLRTLGEQHPSVATTLGNLGMIAADEGRIDDAVRFNERALAIYEAAHGPEHPSVARLLSNLAGDRRDQGRYADALALHERALAIREKLLGAAHPSYAHSLTGIANALFNLGRLAPARAAIERAIRIREAAQGADHEDLAPALDSQGRILLELRVPTACASFDRAVAILERAHGRAHPDLARYVDGAAECALAMGRLADAAALAERVIAMEAVRGVDPAPVAHARFVLARALWRAGRPEDRARAIAAARAARAVLVDRPKYAEDVRAIDAWLRAHA